MFDGFTPVKWKSNSGYHDETAIRACQKALGSQLALHKERHFGRNSGAAAIFTTLEVRPRVSAVRGRGSSSQDQCTTQQEREVFEIGDETDLPKRLEVTQDIDSSRRSITSLRQGHT
jgi:hypothetical protein